MFNLFGSGGERLLGIDIGSSAIKMVELEVRDKKPWLANYAWAECGDLKYSQRADLMRRMLTEAKFKTKRAFFSLPAYSSLVTLIELPSMKEDELASAVRFEAGKYIPTPLSEVVLSWSVIGRSEKRKLEIIERHKEKTDKRLQILLVAAPRRKVVTFEELGKKLGLNIEVIELEIFSMVRALLQEQDQHLVCLVVDIGSRISNIVLVEKGVIRLNRSVDVGGREITRALAESMNISLERAEQLKKTSPDLFGGSSGSIVTPFINLVTAEINRVLSGYQRRTEETASGDIAQAANAAMTAANVEKSGRQKKIDKVIISGGTGRIKGLEEYFTETLGVSTVVGNPWGEIGMEEPVRALAARMGSSFSVAVGLARHGVERFLAK